jgi:hypothetical protein
MKLVKKLLVLLCLALSTAAYAVTYSPYRSAGTRASLASPAADFRSDYSLTAEAPQVAFRSTSAVPVSYYTVKALNADGSVSMAYTADGQNYKQKHVRRGLDLDDEDEPNASLVPVGDIPWLLIVLLVAVRVWMTGCCSRRFLGWTGVRKS